MLSLPQNACNTGQIFHSKATEFYYDCHRSQISPALADVAAGNSIRYAKVGRFIHFNDVDAAGVVVERFGSLWGGKGLDCWPDRISTKLIPEKVRTSPDWVDSFGADPR